MPLTIDERGELPVQLRALSVTESTELQSTSKAELSEAPYAKVLGKKCMAPAGPNTGDSVHSSEGSGRPAVNDGGADRAAPWVG